MLPFSGVGVLVFDGLLTVFMLLFLMDDSLPIPEATKARDGKYQDAARLYIHQRMTNLNEVARTVGLPNAVHLVRVKNKDKWDDFVATIATNTLSSVWGDLGALAGWHPERLHEVRMERERQLAAIPNLRDELARVELALRELEIGSKAYASACSSLRVLSSLLAEFSGLERWLKAVQDAEKRPQPVGDARETRGVVIDL